MKTRVENITPAKAEKLLAKGDFNRKIDQKRVNFYDWLMRNKYWCKNGEPIRIDLNGNTIDKQHVLKAIIRSKTTQEMVIVSGIEENAWMTIDTGRSKSLSHVFDQIGIPNHRIMATATKAAMGFESGISDTKNTIALRYSYHPAARKYYEKNEKLLTRIYEKIQQFNPVFPSLISSSILTAIVLFVLKYDKDGESYVYDFLEDFLVGTNNRASNMPKLLRERLYAEKTVRKTLNQAKICEMALMCIKNYKMDKSLKILRTPAVNPFCEKF